MDCILYLHVPKTAGSSINSYKISKKIDFTIHPISPTGGWEIIKKENKQDWFKFAFVRNPWDRLVSLYFYFYNMQSDHFAYHYDRTTVKNIQRFHTFENFCINFDDFDQNQPFKKFHFFNQHLWTHHQGVSFLDFLGKYETLTEDIKRLETQVGDEHGELPHTNKGNHKHYKSYYTQTTKDIVAEIYKEDIELYGYQF